MAFAARTYPPWASTNPFTIASPRPVPPGFEPGRAVEHVEDTVCFAGRQARAAVRDLKQKVFAFKTGRDFDGSFWRRMQGGVYQQVAQGLLHEDEIHPGEMGSGGDFRFDRMIAQQFGRFEEGRANHVARLAPIEAGPEAGRSGGGPRSTDFARCD